MAYELGLMVHYMTVSAAIISYNAMPIIIISMDIPADIM